MRFVYFLAGVVAGLVVMALGLTTICYKPPLPVPDYARAAACEGALTVSALTGADPNEVFRFHTGKDAAGVCYPKETK